jgi:hypothetical protein
VDAHGMGDLQMTSGRVEWSSALQSCWAVGGTLRSLDLQTWRLSDETG